MKYDGLHPADRLRIAAQGAYEQLRVTDPGGNPVPPWSDDVLEGIADNLAIQAAYVRDQLNGNAAPWRRPKTATGAFHRSTGTITRRVRKALGYSYP